MNRVSLRKASREKRERREGPQRGNQGREGIQGRHSWGRRLRSLVSGAQKKEEGLPPEVVSRAQS